ncbi:hypothetical protein CYMTET_11812 [Cymbomonas tetramitiformis]|uniref:Uncharacterized protein n=1 Tax=Cymbomonas tetramitiformis TaxID=36881 RepID=A0AAE0GLK9_9CHLO|nr:hypothetical protein CYMTET_11812 [Cymbomonas tetramitiformis]
MPRILRISGTNYLNFKVPFRQWRGYEAILLMTCFGNRRISQKRLQQPHPERPISVNNFAPNGAKGTSGSVKFRNGVPVPNTTTLDPLPPLSPRTGDRHVSATPRNMAESDVRLMLCAKDLAAYGVPSEVLDRLYRMIEFYCSGFHNMCKELCETATNPAPLIARIWTIFIKQAEHQFHDVYGSSLSTVLKQMDDNYQVLAQSLDKYNKAKERDSAVHSIMEQALKGARDQLSFEKTHTESRLQHTDDLQKRITQLEAKLHQKEDELEAARNEVEQLAILPIKVGQQCRQLWDLTAAHDKAKKEVIQSHAEAEVADNKRKQSLQQLGLAEEEIQSLKSKVELSELRSHGLESTIRHLEHNIKRAPLRPRRLWGAPVPAVEFGLQHSRPRGCTSCFWDENPRSEAVLSRKVEAEGQGTGKECGKGEERASANKGRRGQMGKDEAKRLQVAVADMERLLENPSNKQQALPSPSCT